MDISSLPQEPAMLMSYVNTKLRDDYPSLDAFCDDMRIDKDELLALLAKGGFEYSESNNKFW